MKKKILFVYTNYSTFVKTDFDILSSEHDVIKYQFKPVKGLFKTGIELIKQFLYLLINSWKFDSIFIWFADTHAFLPVLFSKLFHKKSFVVIGGYDVARIRSLNYGVFISKVRGFCAVYAMKNCFSNLTVSKYVDRKTKWISRSNNTKVIYNCVNLSRNDNEEFSKENLVITVGLINSENTYFLKGIDTFIEVSRLVPELKFIIIGADKKVINKLNPDLPSNLKVVGRTAHHDLIKYYKKAKIYCQFSRSESFGVAIVEAMNFGCVPIVTNVGGMPEVVKDRGKITNRIPEKVSKTIYKIISTENNFANFKGKQFDYSYRKDLILKALIN